MALPQTRTYNDSVTPFRVRTEIAPFAFGAPAVMTNAGRHVHSLFPCDGGISNRTIASMLSPTTEPSPLDSAKAGAGAREMNENTAATMVMKPRGIEQVDRGVDIGNLSLFAQMRVEIVTKPSRCVWSGQSCIHVCADSVGTPRNRVSQRKATWRL